MQLFEYAVIFKPKTKDGKEKTSEDPKVIVPITTVMAENAAEVTLQAARQIPETYSKKLAQCEVAVRPF